MGGMKDVLISIQEDLITEMFPDKDFGDLTYQEADQLLEASIAEWKDMTYAAYDSFKEAKKEQGKWPVCKRCLKEKATNLGFCNECVKQRSKEEESG